MAARVLAGVLAVVLASPPMAPPSDAELEARYQDAVLAGQEGRAEVALALFQWVLDAVPEGHALRAPAVYGAARAALDLGTPAAACRARDLIDTYLGLPDSASEKRARLTPMLPEAARLCDAAVAPPPSAPPPSAPPTSAPLEARLTAAPPPPAETGQGVTIAGWVGVGVGVALLGVGTYAWVQAFDAQSAAESARRRDAHDDHLDDLDSANGLAIGTTAAGAACVATGAGLLLWGGP